jgi:hypothetical protein
MKVCVAVCFLFSSAVYAGVLADTTADFSSTQGGNGWHYGLLSGTFTSSSFTESDLIYNVVTNEWQHPVCCPPWTLIGQNSFMHANGNTNAFGLEWSTREWISNFTGDVTISGSLAKSDISGGNGVTGHIFLNNTEIWTQTIAFNNNGGVTFNLPETISSGDKIFFALDASGTDATPNDFNDSTFFHGTVSTAVPEPATMLGAGLVLCLIVWVFRADDAPQTGV